MSLTINNNYGTVNHIEGSAVQINVRNGRTEIDVEDRPLESERTDSPVTNSVDGNKNVAEMHNIPYENDYKAVVKWLAVEKEQGRDWYRLNNHNRSAMCRQLTEQFGWVVDQNSLLKAQERLTR